MNKTDSRLVGSMPFYSLMLCVVSCGAGKDEFAKLPDCDLNIEDVNIVDVLGERIHAHKDVCIAGSEIVSVTDRAENSSGATQRVPEAGRFLIPGLNDMHVHFRGGEDSIEQNRDLLALYLVHGITGVYDLGSDIPTQMLQWRSDIQSGILDGPDLYLTGPKVDGPDAPFAGSIEVESGEDAEKAIEQLLAVGTDGVKIMGATLSVDAFWQVLAAAKARDFQSLAHLPATISAIDAAERGLGAVAHLAALVDDGSAAADEIRQQRMNGDLSFVETMHAFDRSFEQTRMREVIGRLAQTDTALITTYYGRWLMANGIPDEAIDWERQHYRYVGPTVKDTIETAFVRDQAFAQETQVAWQYRLEHIDWLLGELAKTDIRLLVGSDSGPRNSVPGRVTHREMTLLVRAGLSPAYVLRAATYNPAVFLGRDGREGTIAGGKKANLVLLEANPLQDIANIERIEAVIKSGKYFSRAQLDDILQRLEEKYRD